MGSGIQPGETPSQNLHPQGAPPQINLVHLGNFQFPPGRWLEVRNNIDHLIVIKVEPGNRKIGSGLSGLLLYVQGPPGFIKRYDSISLGVAHPITEDQPTTLQLQGALQNILKAVAIEDVVSQDQTNPAGADELFSDNKGLSQSLRPGLLGVAKYRIS